MLHVSSDYVFDGRAPRTALGAPRAYLESDPTAPLSAYGESKLAGEREVLGASAGTLVVRSAWLFGLGGRNFVATMLRAGRASRPSGGTRARSRSSPTRSARRPGPATSRRP